MRQDIRRFNLILESLVIRSYHDRPGYEYILSVSISELRVLLFVAISGSPELHSSPSCFNLILESLVILRGWVHVGEQIDLACFNLILEILVIRSHCESHYRRGVSIVSISFLRVLLFVEVSTLSPRPARLACFNLRIESLIIRSATGC